jgi:hypothetical protein
MERDGGWVWCAALEEVHTGERRTFASLQALIAFLLAACPEQPGTDRPQNPDVDASI